MRSVDRGMGRRRAAAMVIALALAFAGARSPAAAAPAADPDDAPDTVAAAPAPTDASARAAAASDTSRFYTVVASPSERSTVRADADTLSLAVLPLVNLTGEEDMGSIFTQMLVSELSRLGSVADPGAVDAAMDSLRVRPTSSLAPEDALALQQLLGVRYLIVGTVLEHGTIHSTDARYPCSGLTVRVMDPVRERVVWAATRFHCGDDRERFFGWGRDFDPMSVASTLVTELTRDMASQVWGLGSRMKKGSKP